MQHSAGYLITSRMTTKPKEVTQSSQETVQQIIPVKSHHFWFRFFMSQTNEICQNVKVLH